MIKKVKAYSLSPETIESAQKMADQAGFRSASEFVETAIKTTVAYMQGGGVLSGQSRGGSVEYKIKRRKQ